MSLSPLEYLRHILDEAEYVVINKVLALRKEIQEMLRQEEKRSGKD